MKAMRLEDRPPLEHLARGRGRRLARGRDRLVAWVGVRVRRHSSTGRKARTSARSATPSTPVTALKTECARSSIGSSSGLVRVRVRDRARVRVRVRDRVRVRVRARARVRVRVRVRPPAWRRARAR